jgi:hypothetical protein
MSRKKRLQKQLVRETRRSTSGPNMDPVLHQLLTQGQIHSGKDVRAPWTQPTRPNPEKN